MVVAEATRALLQLLLCRDARARPSVRDVLLSPALQEAARQHHYRPLGTEDSQPASQRALAHAVVP